MKARQVLERVMCMSFGVRKLIRWCKRRLLCLLNLDVFICPDVSLQVERHGSAYGGWVIMKDSLSHRSIVLSAGLGQDISFDESVIAKYGCAIEGYDPAPRALACFAGRDMPPGFTWHQVGWAAREGVMAFHEPYRADWISGTILEGTRGHEKSSIQVPVRDAGTLIAEVARPHVDVVKMDIEGAEYDVIDRLIATGAIAFVRQLLVEYHHGNGRYSGTDTRDSVNRIRNNGFELVYVSETGREFSFRNTRNEIWK
jgi:FkbM family methyltransferase